MWVLTPDKIAVNLSMAISIKKGSLGARRGETEKRHYLEALFSHPTNDDWEVTHTLYWGTEEECDGHLDYLLRAMNP